MKTTNRKLDFSTLVQASAFSEFLLYRFRPGTRFSSHSPQDLSVSWTRNFWLSRIVGYNNNNDDPPAASSPACSRYRKRIIASFTAFPKRVEFQSHKVEGPQCENPYVCRSSGRLPEQQRFVGCWGCGGVTTPRVTGWFVHLQLHCSDVRREVCVVSPTCNHLENQCALDLFVGCFKFHTAAYELAKQ